jgi:hypothetical protein
MGSLLLVGCGGDESTSVTNPPPVETNILDVALQDEEALTVSGVSKTSFNKSAVDVDFLLKGADFDLNKDEVNLSVNETKVESSDLNISAEKISASLKLENGKNELKFKAYDSIGRPLYKNMTLWSGSNAIEVVVVDEQGAPFLKPVDLKVSLSDDPDISSSGTTSTGSLIFSNIPSRTIVVEAHNDNNLIGVSGGLATDGKIIVQMLSFKAANTIKNNDFSLGTSGWDVGTAPTAIVPHEEDIIPTPITEKLAKSTLFPAPRESTNLLKKEVLNNSLEKLQAITDNDLQLNTSGEGKQSLSRTFSVSPGTTSVKVRYRFITSEVPGGYFGSEFNDYFSVSVRSKSKGLVSNESNTMNGLGLGAFNQSTGSTAWRVVSIPTNPEGDEVQVDVSVANVADGELDSSVIIDYVGEDTSKVMPTLSWDAVKGGISLGYKVTGGSLTEATKIKLYWASGKNSSTKIGDAFFEFIVPAGTAEGTGSPVSVAGSFLADNPDNPNNAHYILAVISDTNVFPLKDVYLGFGPQADKSIVPDNMIDIIKDGLRATGVSEGTITSTARTPTDQARAMFNNIVPQTGTPTLDVIAANVKYQIEKVYKTKPGTQVVKFFVTLTKGMEAKEIKNQAASIKAAMVEKIESIGPELVSHHCADSTKITVVDVGASDKLKKNGALFRSSTEPRVTKFLDETKGNDGAKGNNAYHLELVRDK